MLNKRIIHNLDKVGIENWLKSICKSIDIQNLEVTLNIKFFGKVYKIYLDAKNLNHQSLLLNKIIIKAYGCNLNFNYRNHLIYAEDLNINCYEI